MGKGCVSDDAKDSGLGNPVIHGTQGDDTPSKLLHITG